MTVVISREWKARKSDIWHWSTIGTNYSILLLRLSRFCRFYFIQLLGLLNLYNMEHGSIHSVSYLYIRSPSYIHSYVMLYRANRKLAFPSFTVEASLTLQCPKEPPILYQLQVADIY